MNIFNLDYDCYKCLNEGWVVGTSFSNLLKCPVCHNSRLTRIVKHWTYKATVQIFGFFYDALDRLNWASPDMLEFHRLHNRDAKRKVARQIVLEYAAGYTVDMDKVVLAFEVLNASKYFPLGQQSHKMAGEEHQISEDFIKAFNGLTSKR